MICFFSVIECDVWCTVTEDVGCSLLALLLLGEAEADGLRSPALSEPVLWAGGGARPRPCSPPQAQVRGGHPGDTRLLPGLQTQPRAQPDQLGQGGLPTNIPGHQRGEYRGGEIFLPSTCRHPRPCQTPLWPARPGAGGEWLPQSHSDLRGPPTGD